MMLSYDHIDRNVFMIQVFIHQNKVMLLMATSKK